MTRGFTLLEILVTISLLLMAFTTGLVAYQKAARNQALDADVAKIVQVLNTAKTNVKSGKKIGCGTDALEAWKVSSTGNKRITLEVVCSGAKSPVATDLSSTVSAFSVQFPFLGVITSPPTITVTGTNNVSKNIVITSTGEIRSP